MSSNLFDPLVLVFSLTPMRGVRRCALYGVWRAASFFSQFLLMVDVIVMIRLFYLVVYCGSPLMKAIDLMWIDASKLVFGLMMDFG